jgi:hypothetical protein
MRQVTNAMTARIKMATTIPPYPPVSPGLRRVTRRWNGRGARLTDAPGE